MGPLIGDGHLYALLFFFLRLFSERAFYQRTRKARTISYIRMFPKIERLTKNERIFCRPYFESTFIDHIMLTDRRRLDDIASGGFDSSFKDNFNKFTEFLGQFYLILGKII